VILPRSQCELCGEAVKEEYKRCYNCNSENNPVGDELSRVFSVSFYLNTDIKRHELSRETNDAKKMRNLEKMTNVLSWGVNNFNELQNFDALVPPPRGDEDAEENHMHQIAEMVSENVGIPSHDILSKSEEYKSQKEIG